MTWTDDLGRLTLPSADAHVTPETVGAKKTFGFVLYDGSGNIVSSFGGSGGTEYTEGDSDSSITGTAFLWEDAADTVRPVSAAKPLPVSLISAVTPFAKAATSTHANVNTSTTSATLLAANTARLGFSIVNESLVVLYVKFGATASATSYKYALLPGQSLDSTGMLGLYTGVIDGILASSTGVARVAEETA